MVNSGRYIKMSGYLQRPTSMGYLHSSMVCFEVCWPVVLGNSGFGGGCERTSD